MGDVDVEQQDRATVLATVGEIIGSIDAPTRKLHSRLVPSTREENLCGTRQLLWRMKRGEHAHWPRWCKSWHCPNCVKWRRDGLAERALLAFSDDKVIDVLQINPAKRDSFLRAVRRASARGDSEKHYIAIRVGGLELIVTNAECAQGTIGVVRRDGLPAHCVDSLLHRITDTFHLEGSKPVTLSHGFPNLPIRASSVVDQRVATLSHEEARRFRREFDGLHDLELERDPNVPAERSELLERRPDLFAELEREAVDEVRGVGF